MPLLLILKNRAASAETALEMTVPLTGQVGGFLELSQMMTGRVPEPSIVLDTYLTGVVPGFTAVALHPDGTPLTPVYLPGAEQSGGVFDLAMSAGGMAVESFSWSAERGQGTRMDVTVIGDARGAAVPSVTASAGAYGGVFSAAGTLPEWEWSRDSVGETTVLHGSDAPLRSKAELPELVPWERQEEKDARATKEKAERIAKVPVAQRESARTDWRRMPVDQVVMQALATVPHRLLVAPPFPGYDFRAHSDGPSYSTLGKTAEDVVRDIWGKVGIQVGWEGGVLVVRPGGPAGDVVLGAPIGSERQERVVLDTPTFELEGGKPAGSDTGDDIEGNDDDSRPTNPDDPRHSPDPDERKGEGGKGFAEGISPTPEVVGSVAATAVPLRWAAVPNASQYILERIEGAGTTPAVGTLWTQITNTTATRWTDDTALPMRTYHYRLRVNAAAFAGSTQNTIWQPSELLTVVTPPADTEGAPAPVTDLTAYYRSETAVGVKWTPPKADPLDQPPPRKPAADRYDVEVRNAAGTLLKAVLVWQSWVLLDGLPVGAKLTISVKARNGTHASEPVLLEAQLVNLPPAQVGKVDVQAVEKKPVLTASWLPVTSATEYQVELARDTGDGEAALRWEQHGTVPTPQVPDEKADGRAEQKDLSLVLENLHWGTRYAVRVRGLNELGPGGWSAIVYEVTSTEPPQEEPDPESDAFERTRTTSVKTSRKTDNFAEETTTWKQGGRVTAIEERQWGRVALIEREDEDYTQQTAPPAIWLPFSATTTKNFYEIPDWPETLTASVTETILFDRSPNRSGQEAGREQTRVHQEWSPQGWLSRRATEKRRAGWVIGQEDDGGKIIRREMGTYAEYTVEEWLPVGGGLWLYRKSGTTAALTPTYIPGPLGEDGKPTAGEWTHLETAIRPLEGETTVSENAPPQATRPQERDKDGDKQPPPLPRNTDSPALARYPLDEPWFSVREPGPPPGEEGPTTKDDKTPDDPLPEPPTSPNDPVPTPEGSSDTSGNPEPDEPKPGDDDTEPLSLTHDMEGSDAASGGTVTSALPWVRTAAGLARYAEMLASAYGPRTRITRTYLLPTTPPGLDQAVSVTASGSAGQFEMTVITEKR
ncbi:MAG: hypothetical protein Q4C89_00850 [Deinococcus sp.]|uniref:hypothetical protein n=1 Tax=Deinococcus sp. TaxID=47478 RepID=UPI0026DD4FED|nr:hypothetical protein [Deinococcus sp.]MDO4244557.1 hypothetical protein [Deinococcus sp.]